ncbi:MAG TPA: DUF5020 family protein [Rhodothermales bacterium]
MHRHRLLALILLAFTATAGRAQTVQLEYDLRHTVDPTNNEKNFPRLSFEVVRVLGYGNLLAKVDADFTGRNNNLGKLYAQISHTLRFWPVPVWLHLEYSGGLGLIGESTDGFAINNTFAVGAARPFQMMGSWASTFLAYRVTNFDTPSHDLMYSFWWGKDVHPRVGITAYVVLWTINRNHGDAWTEDLSGKEFVAIGEPQVWFRLNDTFSVGSEVKLYYRVYSYSKRVLVYPTLAVQYSL